MPIRPNISTGPTLKKRVETKKLELQLIVYVPIKRRPTGDRAEMEEDEMMFDVAEEARKEMLLS